MHDSDRTREGYLVIADIAGYTRFLVGTELEHAQSIVEELTNLIRRRLVPPLRFVKLEGDAVFCYADARTLHEGESLVELLEVCYFEFSNLLFNMERATTCRCAACASIGSLDLKFVAHYGSFVAQRGAGGEDVAGPDVILVHRLLKNTITERTGIGAYVFFTGACMERLPPRFELLKHSENYESFGETSGAVHDLGPVLEQMRQQRREYVSAEGADYEATIEVPYPPPVVWQYVVDPVQRLRWACVLFDKNPDTVARNEHGRAGVGGKVHCNHGPAEAYREVIDWRPFNYFTLRGLAQFRGGFIPARQMVETFELGPRADGGTRLSWRIRFLDRSRFSMLTLKAITLLFRGGVGYGKAKLQAALEEDMAAALGPTS